jgi:hypothetical protein
MSWGRRLGKRSPRDEKFSVADWARTDAVVLLLVGYGQREDFLFGDWCARTANAKGEVKQPV